MALRFEASVARRYLRAQRRSRFTSLISIFSMAGVFIGTGSLVVATSLLNGFESQVRDKLIGRDSHFDMLGILGEPLPEGDSLRRAIETADSRVLAAAPFIYGKGGISSATAADGIVVMGIDPKHSAKVIDVEKYVTDGKLDLQTRDLDSGRIEHGCAMGFALAGRLGVTTGDPVTLISLSSPQALSGMGPPPRVARCRVSAIFATGMYEFDANLAYIGIPAAQKLFDMPGAVTGYQVRVQDLWQAREVAEAVGEKLGGGYRTLDWLTKNAALMKWMKLEKVVVTLVLCLIILVAAFNIASSLIMGVLEKTREIGILRAMGATEGSILRIFLLQGSLVGVIGSTAGTLFGLLLCWVQWRFQVIKLPGDIYFIDQLPVEVHRNDVLLIVVVANIICLAASLYPAWRASRLLPVEAIRHE